MARISDPIVIIVVTFLVLANARATIKFTFKNLTDTQRFARRTCGTGPPPVDLLDQHRWLEANEQGDNDLWSASAVSDRIARYHPLGKRNYLISDLDDPYRDPYSHQSRLQHYYNANDDDDDDDNHSDTERRQQRARPARLLKSRQSTPWLFFVDVWMHIVQDTASASPTSPRYISPTMLRRQISYLNNAYARVGIVYRLVNSTRTTNDLWARNGNDLAMKRALRRGSYSTLNVYYQTLLQASSRQPGIPAGSLLLGFCSMPSLDISQSSRPAAYASDGCNILAGTLPGAWQTNYNSGGTTAHEVGHWHGLLHTFHNNNCNPNDFGDYVADTPQQKNSTTGCPALKDTCPNSGVDPEVYDPTSANAAQGYAGPDAIHNFMDYSWDACYQGFTTGQAARMINIWGIYRAGR